MKTRLAALAAIIAGLSLSIGMSRAEAATFDLYTGSGLPADQEWLTFTNLIGASQNIVSGGVNLNTNPTNSSASNPIYAGYSNYNSSSGQLKKDTFPPLNRIAGYTLNFNVKINSEDHDGTNGPNRAGFSVIAISEDLQGIELGFWSDQIWAQNTDFTKGEPSSFTTTSSLTSYALRVSGNSYTLSSNNNTLLTGNLRNYASTSLQPQYAPYGTRNLIFLGDDTTSARADFTLGAVSVATPVPFEFSPTLGLLILGGWAAFHQLKNQKKCHAAKRQFVIRNS